MSKIKSSKRVIDSDDDVRPAKKGRTSGTNVSVSGSAQRDKDGDLYWELSSSRRVSVTSFKGKQMINIREYYEKDGQHLPGKKGISLPIEQYTALLHALPQIESALKDQGLEVPRPNYGPGGGNDSGEDIDDLPKADEEDEVEDVKSTEANGRSPSRQDRFKLDKKNHEATSEEDD
ncbi:hypothetical protein CAC42_2925 [Sphaceloma murrayae]|uniref:Transcriptional coactivator p15 (PC4) C-terminal domain-containing protein n=1 Tax=Sphaceloma murrayae TaxID=2082308 RepID=A0A2K1R0C9_9PEZI|nr:hypothetical protein CAC42_2925 [Sphaceloma murrayae]